MNFLIYFIVSEHAILKWQWIQIYYFKYSFGTTVFAIYNYVEGIEAFVHLHYKTVVCKSALQSPRIFMKIHRYINSITLMRRWEAGGKSIQDSFLEKFPDNFDDWLCWRATFLNVTGRDVLELQYFGFIRNRREFLSNTPELFMTLW